MDKIKLKKRTFLYSASIILGMNLLAIDAKAEENNNVKSTNTSSEPISENNSNDATVSDDTKDEENGTGVEEQIDLHFAKVVTDSELFTPETLQSTHLTLPASDYTYHVKQSSNKEYVEIQFAGNTYWVKLDNVEASNDQPIELDQKRHLTIKTKSKFKVYPSNKIQSKTLIEGTTASKFQVLDVVNHYYVVDVAGVKGYIPFEQVNISYKKNSNVEVATESVKLLKAVKGKYKVMGSLRSGAVVKVTNTTTNYHQVQIGTQKYAISKKGTIPTELSASLGKLVKEVYPVSLKVSSTNYVYSSKGSKIGTISKGQYVSLKGLKGNKGIINFMGKSGYVNLKYYNHSNMVNPKNSITYGKYNYYLRVIAQLYPEFTEIEKIGKSVQGRSIYALRVGNGKKEILMDGAVHAREHMTTNVLMEMIDTYTVAYRTGSSYAGYNVKSTLNKTSIWFVPMMNPDGVTLVQKGINSMDSKYKSTLKKSNHGSNNFNRWKANGRGVDLNRNFDGLWKYIAYTPKSFMNYKGTSAFSEPEAQALKSFVQRHHFKMDLSYHSSGQIVYWFNFQKGSNYNRDLKLAKNVARITGYSVVPPMYYRGSGSSADWFILNQKRPGLTIEIAPYAGNGPVPHRYWNSVWNKNKSIGLFGAKEASK